MMTMVMVMVTITMMTRMRMLKVVTAGSPACGDAP